MDEKELLEIEVTPNFKLFYSEESSYGIFPVDVKDESPDIDKIKFSNQILNRITIVGSMPDLKPNKTYVAKVFEVTHPKYGLQYEVQTIYEKLFTTRASQVEFLKVLLTEKQMESLLEAYPDDNLVDIIKDDKIDVSKTKGIGEATLEKIKQKITDNEKYQQAVVHLTAKYGIPYNSVKTLSDKYGSPNILLDKVEKNPYILTEVHGFGFKKVDVIALSMGIPLDSPMRIESCIDFCLEEEANNGHAWMKITRIVEKVMDLTGLGLKQLETFIENMENSKDNVPKEIRVKRGIVYKEKYKFYEESIKNDLLRIMDQEFPYQYDDERVKKAILDVEQDQGFKFTEEQIKAIYSATENNVLVISGKAGSGKTSVIKGIMAVLTSVNTKDEPLVEVGACALSGKASQRIFEATGFKAMTMHRLLGYNPNTGWAHNHENPLFHNIIFVDEFSMINTELAFRLTSAVANGSKLIIAGDVGQLEPIGVGNVLVDLIESNAVPAIELTIVHRQAQKSGILSSANKVREGEFFTGSQSTKKEVVGEMKDLYYYPYNSGDMVEKRILNIAERYKGNVMDFQIMVPMKNRGKLSTKNLNNELQLIFNTNPEEVPKSKKITRGEVTFVEDDKVIINGNNYDKNVFNGTMGMITYIDSLKTDGEIVIDFDTVGQVSFTKDEMKQIDLGYAVTIHKCVSGETFIYTDEGIMQIKDIDKDNMPLVYNGKYMEKPSEFIEVEKEEVITLTTSRGYSLTGTRDHKIEVFGEKGFPVTKELKDVKKDDNILLQVGQNVYGDLTDISEYSNISTNVRAVRYNIPTVLDEDVSLLLGMMVADGTITKSGIRLSKRYKEVSETFARLIKKIFGYRYVEPVFRKSGDYIVEINSTHISGFFQNIGGLQPHEKYVPDAILKTNYNNQVKFLQGLFEDGSVNIKNGYFDHIELTMKSELMSKQLQMMLLNMGVKTTKRQLTSKLKTGKIHKSFVLYIYKESLEEFRKIGFVSRLKNERLYMLKDPNMISPRKSIPHISSLVRRFLKDAGVDFNSKDVEYKWTGKKNMTPSKVNTLIEKHKKKLVKYNKNLYNYLYRLCNDVFLDKVVNLEESEDKTYCFTMPETGMFTQNGVRGFNCQGSQWKHVVLGLDNSSYIMLNKQLLYTGMTRAQEYLFLVAEKKALNKAIKTNNSKKRNTFLKKMFKDHAKKSAK